MQCSSKKGIKRSLSSQFSIHLQHTRIVADSSLFFLINSWDSPYVRVEPINAIWHVLLLVYDIQYMAISMCRLNASKTIESHNHIKRFSTLVLCYEFGWSLVGLQVQHQMCKEKMVRNTTFILHSALNPCFVAESRMGDL